MPKIIENLEERIVLVARRILSEKGYQGLRIRDVASECGIALGTMYNYYNSKEMLVGSIMLEDWKKALSDMDRGIGMSESLHEALSSIAQGLDAFCSMYFVVWADYGSPTGSISSYKERHAMLVGALSERVGSALARFGMENGERLCEVYSEALITMATHQRPYEEYADILERMIR